MEAEQQQQQWIVVKSRKRKHIEKMVRPEKIFTKGGNAVFLKEVNIGLQEQFLNHANTQDNIRTIANMIKAVEFKKTQIVCLGIGNFTSYLKPQLQMLFLKNCILKAFQQAQRQFSINIYDPIFSNEQKEEITYLKATCKEFISLEDETSFIMYMPHCDRFLYQLICQSKLKHPNCQVVVIGNSINQYKQRCKITNQAIPKVFESFSPIDTKIKDYKQAFNDTYIYTL